MKAQIFNIHDVVLLMTVAECFLLAIFQAVLPVTNRLASVLLSCFLLCVAVGSACILVLWNGDVHVQPFFDRYLLPYFLVTALILKGPRSEEHTSELQSRENLVCRLLLEKKNIISKQ